MMGADLGKRVAERASEATGAEVSRRETTDLIQVIKTMTPEIQKALPAHMDATRMARLLLTSLRTVKNLDRCTPESFAGALMNLSQIGLEPGPMGEAYLVPFKDGFKSNQLGFEVYECTLIPGYKGMVKLFYQSPLGKRIGAEAVYEGDEFDYAKGLEPYLIHKPSHGDRGEIRCYYAAATMTNGGSEFVVMYPDEIERIKSRSPSARSKTSPWVTDLIPMSKKTCVRQLFRWLPQSAEMAYALVHDGAIRTDSSPEGIDRPPRYIEAETEAPAIGGAEESMYCAGCARVMKPSEHDSYVAGLPPEAAHDPSWEYPGEAVT